MTRFLPTGPASVGLEVAILPCRSDVEGEAGGGTLILCVPACRFGAARYRLTLSWDAEPGFRGISVGYGSEPVESGSRTDFGLIGEDVTVSRADLEMVSFIPDHDAMADLSEAELLDALAHPIEAVRLAAIVALPGGLPTSDSGVHLRR